MTSPRVIVVPVLHDNYAYAVVSGHDVLIIDPGEAAPVVAAIEKNNLTPRAVLITHYDHDHTGGVAELRRIFNMKVIGPSPSPLKMDEVCQSGQIRFRTLLFMNPPIGGFFPAIACSVPAAVGCPGHRPRSCGNLFNHWPHCPTIRACFSDTNTPCQTCRSPHPSNRKIMISRRAASGWRNT
jgi:Metallo-beta-lactamase superfamily